VSRIFIAENLRQILTDAERSALVADFKRYLSGASVPNFGRDELYDHPHTPPLIRAEEVAHIHLEDSTRPWPRGWDPARRTSDAHLVYCRGVLNSDYYLLMAILRPDAHEQARHFNIMAKLGVMAETFRRQY
jgi:mRNA interferase YafO